MRNGSGQDPFKEYLRQMEPSKRDKGYAWNTAIGLQAVDGLKPSKYLVETAIQNIEGKITIEEAQKLLDAYYKENPHMEDEDDRTEEADIGEEKADIGEEKADIDVLKEYGNLLLPFSVKTITHVQKMYEVFGKNIIFGRADVQAVTGLKHTRASELLSVLAEAKIIGHVAGHGKGKYRFLRWRRVE